MSDEEDTTPLLLKRWLGGESIRSLAGANSRREWKADEAVEHQLRVELLEFQKHVVTVERVGLTAIASRKAMVDNAEKFHALLKILGDQSAEVSLCFGEWADTEFYRGYLAGKGMQARVMQMAFGYLANVVRARSTADQEVET